MSRKQSQPRRLRASFPPTPSPATSDRRAASYLARLREWRRQDRTSPLHRSGSTRVSSSRSTSAAAAPERALQRRQTPERIISPGYRSDHLYDRLLAKAGARCLPCALCGGLAAPAFIRPHGRGWKIIGTAPIATIFAEEVVSPKSICVWAKSGQGRTSYEQTVLRARKMG